MKNLVKEYLKRKFFEDKDAVIEEYKNGTISNFEIYEYTKGKKVIIDFNTSKAYSKNGFLYCVILKNDTYIEYLANTKLNEILEYLDDSLSARYDDDEGDTDLEDLKEEDED